MNIPATAVLLLSERGSHRTQIDQSVQSHPRENVRIRPAIRSTTRPALPGVLTPALPCPALPCPLSASVLLLSDIIHGENTSGNTYHAINQSSKTVRSVEQQ